MSEVSHPIEGQVVLLAGAKASVPLPRLSELLETAQQYLGEHHEEYDRRFERIEGTAGAIYFLADEGYWDVIGEQLALDEREVDALRRTHAAQFERDGRRLDRIEEFETTLEIRDVVAIAPAD